MHGCSHIIAVVQDNLALLYHSEIGLNMSPMPGADLGFSEGGG